MKGALEANESTPDAPPLAGDADDENIEDTETEMGNRPSPNHSTASAELLLEKGNHQQESEANQPVISPLVAFGVGVEDIDDARNGDKEASANPPLLTRSARLAPPSTQPGAVTIIGVGIARAAVQPGAVSVRGSGDRTSQDSNTAIDDEDIHQDGREATNGQSTVMEPAVSSTTTIVSAVRVGEDKAAELAEMEAEIRDRIRHEAVEANVVPETQTARASNRNQKYTLVLCFAAVIVVAAVILGVLLGTSGDNEASTNMPATAVEEDNRPTLDIIRERGHVLCGVYDAALGFSFPDPETGELDGMNIEQCRAVSIAVFGSSDKFEPVIVNSKTRFPALANRTADLIATTATHTMSRDVFESNTQSGFTFTTPYFYSGIAFGGVPFFVDCADILDTFFGDCRSMKICVGSGTTHEKIMKDLLPGTFIVFTETRQEAVDRLADGSCNVIASEPVSMPEVRFRQMGYAGPLAIGNNVFSKEPLAIATRDNDREWSSLVDTIVNTLYLAEAEGITQSNAQTLGSLFPNHTELASVMVAIVAEIGNYGDLYEKHLESVLPRKGLNTIYSTNQSTGLIYSIPFGDLETTGPGVDSEMALGGILARGYLRCAVSSRPGFATFNEDSGWFGLDIEFCRLLSAALFAGETKTVEFVDLSSGVESALYASLANDDVDVVAGTRVALQARYHEPTTGLGFAFSPPYFYDNDTGDAIALMTKAESSLFADFVYWTVMATFYADEMNILQSSSAEMPVVSLFGEAFKQMFRDSLLAVGSYSEIYNRTLASILPRSGGNMLNEGLSGPQQYPFHT